LMEGLRNLQSKFPVIGDVRGQGLMIATEFTKADGTPDAETTAKALKGCLEQNLLLLSCGTYKNVLRWIPPLIVTKEQINEALETFKQVMGRIEA
ncbi:MAG: aminotransferase class III-fold pyridoxal phosphate-dependent enzyme, partial [Flavobacteriaceae bacterium]